MEKKKIMVLILIIMIIVIGLFFCLFHMSMRQSDATIERIDKKIEMYERSR